VLPLECLVVDPDPDAMVMATINHQQKTAASRLRSMPLKPSMKPPKQLAPNTTKRLSAGLLSPELGYRSTPCLLSQSWGAAIYSAKQARISAETAVTSADIARDNENRDLRAYVYFDARIAQFPKDAPNQVCHLS
jgi:hypothetical protein